MAGLATIAPRVRKNSQTSGMQGVFLVAAQLAKRDFVVSLTSRSAKGADLLVTDLLCRRSFSIQVKTNRGNPNFWLIGPAASMYVSKTHWYVLVNLGKDDPKFYIVPSRIVASETRENRRKNSVWYEFKRDEKYRDRWARFGNA